MEFEKTECQTCGSKESPLYMMSPPHHAEDVACETHKPKLQEERAK